MKNRRIIGLVTVLGAAALAGFALVSCGQAVAIPPAPPPPPILSDDDMMGAGINKLTLNVERDTIDVARAAIITAKVEPNIENTEITWTSSNTDVAEIRSASGRFCEVIGIDGGYTILTASAGGLTASCTVAVNPNSGPIHPTRIDSLYDSHVLRALGKRTTTTGYIHVYPNYTGGINPANGQRTNYEITISSSNPSVATVELQPNPENYYSRTYYVTAVSEGKCVITAISSNGLVREIPVTVSSPMEIEMVTVPGGSFTFGQGQTGARTYQMHGFRMSKYPITQEQYESVMGENPSRWQDPKRPVESVTLRDGYNFCEALNDYYELRSPIWSYSGSYNYSSLGGPPGLNKGNGYRLPTEMEWEYACRAGATGTYNSENATTFAISGANYAASNLYETTPVGTYADHTTSTYGLMDMNGNVNEWVWGELKPYADFTSPLNLSLTLYTTYVPAPSLTPHEETRCVIRGGSWEDPVANLAITYRRDELHLAKKSTIGFRVVLPIEGSDWVYQ